MRALAVAKETYLRINEAGIMCVQHQVESCQRLGIRRVVLVSSLCAGRWRHPLNLFGLILVWKRIGEQRLERSGLDWTVIRPGGLSERETDLEQEGIRYSNADQQESDSIPRRLVARCCVEALATPAAGYSFVYHLEIGLLFVTLATLGPLVRTPILTRQPEYGSARIGLAEFPT